MDDSFVHSLDILHVMNITESELWMKLRNFNRTKCNDHPDCHLFSRLDIHDFWVYLTPEPI